MSDPEDFDWEDFDGTVAPSIHIDWSKEKIDRTKKIIPALYRCGALQTIFNAEKEEYQRNGFRLKKKTYHKLRDNTHEDDPGDWSPIFLNLRDLGSDELGLFLYICDSMALLIREEMPEVNKILGIDYAGIPYATAISTLSRRNYKRKLTFCYTRSVNGVKLRTPGEAEEVLRNLGGQKSLVEGKIGEGDRFASVDDVITDAGSKIIAGKKLAYEAERKGIKDYSLDHVGVVLDRQQGGGEQLYKEGNKLHSMVKMEGALELLKPIMKPNEYAICVDYMRNEELYQFHKEIEHVTTKRIPINGFEKRIQHLL